LPACDPFKPRPRQRPPVELQGAEAAAKVAEKLGGDTAVEEPHYYYSPAHGPHGGPLFLYRFKTSPEVVSRIIVSRSMTEHPRGEYLPSNFHVGPEETQSMPAWWAPHHAQNRSFYHVENSHQAGDAAGERSNYSLLVDERTRTVFLVVEAAYP
jgi:hypothetical protein